MNTLYIGDCLEMMNDILSQSIDMILTDLPYGTTRNIWDCTLPLEPLWRQYTRVAKEHAAIVLFAQVPFSIVLGASNVNMLRYEWIWKKGNATGHLNANRCPLKAHENILVFYQKLPTYHPQFRYEEPYQRAKRKVQSSNYGKAAKEYATRHADGKRYPVDVLLFTEERVLHPTQKPVALCEYLIQTYTNEGEVILDSCMGSGTTCVAAVKTRRQYIGIEINQDYFTIAQDRLIKEAAE